MLDNFDQKYTVFNHIQEFRKIQNIGEVLFGKPQSKISSWSLSEKICVFVNNLSEELVSAEKLIKDDSAEISTVGQILKLYQEILTKNNLLDFASIHVETYLLLKNNPAIINHQKYDSLGKFPKKQGNTLMEKIEDKYFQRPTFEPRDQTKFFDFWRLYYTAFSRAQDLLILTCDEKGGQGKTPSKYFSSIFETLTDAENKAFDISEFDFHKVKDVNIKEQFSFTSHISVYETCGLQYKFYKELEFSPVRVNSMLFGILVHETIEDIHRAALRNEFEEINNANIEAWFNSNYETFSKKEHAYLAPAQLNVAFVEQRMDKKSAT